MDDWEHCPLCGYVHSASVTCAHDPWADDPVEVWKTYLIETGQVYA